MKYFYINNKKFNYDLEFKNNLSHSFWKQNVPLIEYCETLGITIPHYCYHKNLSISGNCRMCLVELKNSPKPIVSCAMNAKSCLANSDVYTNSALVKKARENVLEFLLLNHPLDCPICDQGGECDLQDQSLFFGLTKKRFYSFKRVVINKNIGPIVKTVMTRCIHCTRCVRFAAEVAGIDDLGMFGRGLQSEIGTYIEKVFQSELSGNVIDLCPVGALTSKAYSFVNRNWELKNVTSVDFSDGFCTSIQIFIKNNKIIKILPGYEKSIYKTNWISDKTRFSFDGMFSPEKIVNNFINYKNKKPFINLSWKKLFTEFFYIIYFQTQLKNHLYKPIQITICLSKTMNLETLSSLSILAQKYSFFKIRRAESQNLNCDLENNYLFNSSLDGSQISRSNTCVLIGVNPRYEGFQLNLKLRTRHLKGNFKIVNISSLVNLTYDTVNVSNSTRILKSLVSGNNIFCQEFTNSVNPILVTNSKIFKRKDSTALIDLLTLLLKYTCDHSRSTTKNKLNILSSVINEVGLMNFNVLKTISNKDFKHSTGIYFLNNSYSTSNIKKLLNLKLLNYFQYYTETNKFLITQADHIETQFLTQIKKGFNSLCHIHLPNANFYETSGTYINTEGNLKKTTKIITSLGQTKSDWQIIRKITSYSKKTLFIENFFTNSNITAKIDDTNRFKNYIGFQYYPTSSLNNLSFYLLEKISNYTLNTTQFKKSRKKLFASQFKLWLNDFFIDDNDSNSKYSSLMIQCSKLSRLKNTNLKF